MLDVGLWQKWLQTHRIGLLLAVDASSQGQSILPKHLHTPNHAGRFHNIQCRQAQCQVNAFLRSWSTFVLVENHSYIKMDR